MAFGPITSWQIDGETIEAMRDSIFLGSKVTADGDGSREVQRCLETKLWPTWQQIKKRRHYFANRGLSNQSYGFSSSHVWMWESDHKEGWAPKNRCFWTVVLEKILENPLDFKEIKPVNSLGNQPWLFIGGTDAEVEAPALWPPDAKSWLIGKDPDAGKYWRQEEKVMTENEMVGWHHWLNGHEFEQAPGDGGEQGSLVCYSSWGCRVRYDLAIEQHWIRAHLKPVWPYLDLITSARPYSQIRSHPQGED